ncbi:MAG: carbohydrate ABC transporter permease [Paracoccaceae bacterium]
MATSERAGRIAGYAFVAPAILLMLVILIVPMGIAATLSFTDYSLGNPSFNWVGLGNYERLVSRTRYERMFQATFTYVFVAAPLTILLGLGAALLINSLAWGRDFYKTVYFLPVMATLIAMAIVWQFALHPTVGIVNDLLGGLCGTWLELGWVARRCEDGFPNWLGDRDYAIWVVIFVGVWQGFGFNMVLYLAGLTAIPRDLYAAAEMDGARTAWDRFRLVTWPMLGPTTVFVVTISIIRAFQVFDIVEAFYPQGAGPGRSAYVILFAIFEKGVKENLIGIGAAITVVFLVFVLAVTLAQKTLLERRVHYG